MIDKCLYLVLTPFFLDIDKRLLQQYNRCYLTNVFAYKTHETLSKGHTHALTRTRADTGTLIIFSSNTGMPMPPPGANPNINRVTDENGWEEL